MYCNTTTCIIKLHTWGIKTFDKMIQIFSPFAMDYIRNICDTYRGLEEVKVSVLTPNFISVGYKIQHHPHYRKCH